MLVEAELPDDPALLQAMLVGARGEIRRRDQQITGGFSQQINPALLSTVLGGDQSGGT